MVTVERWQLPDGVEEVLPAQAAVVEGLRRQLLDLYHSWGYQLVIPPLVEFTESLLIGLGKDLDLLTFRMTDQLSGRTLGVRADITPQVARIDAHSLAQPGVTRLCYAGSVLHTRPKSLMASRSPIQVGAELYGDDSLAADLEIIQLMLATLDAAGVRRITLDLGHVGVYEAVLAAAALDGEREAEVFDALQRKSRPDLEQALAGVEAASASLITGLLDLHGDEAMLGLARERLAEHAPAALQAVATLEAMASSLLAVRPDLQLYFDLAELRGYHYHTGIVFAAYAPGHGQALANGGRYNDVGRVFGRARPATGFATDLKALMSLMPPLQPPQGAIDAPSSQAPGLLEAIRHLRASGEVVIARLGASPDPRCTRTLVENNGEWRVQALNT